MLDYFQHLEQRPVERLLLLVSGLLFFWILEGFIPLLPLRYQKSKVHHAGVNFFFTIIHLIIHTFLALVIIKISDACATAQFGIVYWAKVNVLWTLVIACLTLDFFGGWLVHFTEHKVPFLWRFHVIHHADQHVDVTTGLRHHPGESLLRGLFFFMGIAVSGAPMYAVMFFQTILVFATAFTHANIQLSDKLDKLISYIFISPNMHKVHHHYQQPYTDTNYGAVFSLWDRLLRTFSTLPYAKLRYGIDRTFPEKEGEHIFWMLKFPFIHYSPTKSEDVK